MSTKQPTLNLAMPIVLLLAMIALLSGCDSAEENSGQTEAHAPVGQTDVAHQPLSEVLEVDGFTLQVNVARTEFLDEARPQLHDIDPGPDHAVLNLVILDSRRDGDPETVSADVTVEYQSQMGQVKTIDMRSVEEQGYISYIGILDAGSQRVFNFSIEAQPAGTDEPLQMDFEVELDW